MGINDEILAEFELESGEEIHIEHTEDRQVHIHIDNMRLNITEAEFKKLVATTDDALDELVEMKQL